MIEKRKYQKHKLTPALIKKANTYLEDEGYKTADDLVPSVAGLACYLNISLAKLTQFAHENTQLAEIMAQVSTVQERILINGGLSGEFNTSMIKMLLAKPNTTERIDKSGEQNEEDASFNIEHTLAALFSLE